MAAAADQLSTPGRSSSGGCTVAGWSKCGSIPVRPPSDRVTLGSRVEWAGEVLADSIHALRVPETSHPPTIYIPPADVPLSLLTASNARPTWCEFKGEARYLDAIVTGHRAHAVAWSYPAPAAGYETLRDHVAFYPG